MLTLEDRFWARVWKGAPGGCWEWRGAIDGHGYGSAWSPRLGRVTQAHRHAYELCVGELPEDVCVCHKCDIPLCVNPDHLFLGSRADNLKDMRDKGRDSRGSRSPIAKLTEDVVADIRARYRAGGVTMRELGEEVGVASATIYSAIKRKSWKHVP